MTNVHTLRRSCGTHMGLLLHRDLGEQPCGKCLQAERARLVAAEYTPTPEHHQQPAWLRNDPELVQQRLYVLENSYRRAQ